MTGSRDREGRAVRVSPPQRGGAAAASSPRPQGFVSHAAACLVSRGSLGDPRRWTRHQRVDATPGANRVAGGDSGMGNAVFRPRRKWHVTFSQNSLSKTGFKDPSDRLLRGRSPETLGEVSQ